MPATAPKSAGPRVSPGQPSCTSKSVYDVRLEAKTFVSCWKPPTAMHAIGGEDERRCHARWVSSQFVSSVKECVAPRRGPTTSASASSVAAAAIRLNMPASASACKAPSLIWARNEHVDDSGQLADVATPRADCQFLRCDKFCNWHHKLKREASKYRPAANTSSSLALVGDSMIEALRKDAPSKKVATASLRSTLVGRYWPHALLLGSGGAETQHVLWRLQDGELSPAMRSDMRLLIGLLIGTNNLGAGHRARDVAVGIDAISRYVLANSHARVLVIALLPRGDRWRSGICPTRCGRAGTHVPLKGSRPSEIAGAAPKFCPSACARKRQLVSWMPVIDAVNERLRNDIVPSLAKQFGSQRVRFADCGRTFRARYGMLPPARRDNGRLTPATARAASKDVNLTYLPDALHLSSIAYMELMNCMAYNLRSLALRTRIEQKRRVRS